MPPESLLDMNTPELAELLAAFTATVEPYERARKARLDAEVGVARGLLRAFADRYAGVEAYDFEENSEYDDEGGYYTVVTGTIAWAEDTKLSDSLRDDATDTLDEITHQWLTAEVLEEVGHHVTVAQLRPAA